MTEKKMTEKMKIKFKTSGGSGSVYDDPNDETTKPWVSLPPDQTKLDSLTRRIGSALTRHFSRK